MQEKIIEALAKANEPLGRTEIAVRINCRPITVSDRLKTMVKHEEVECIEICRHLARELFSAKRRMKIYYLIGITNPKTYKNKTKIPDDCDCPQGKAISFS